MKKRSTDKPQERSVRGFRETPSSACNRSKMFKTPIVRRLLGIFTVLVLFVGGSESYGQDYPGFFLDPGKAITQYQLNTWTTNDGLPQITVTAITQTRDGYLWVGTQEGLVRFDGLGFKVYDKGNSAFTQNTISALYEDQGGNLWIGTRGGGLVRYRDGQFDRYSEADGLTSENISSIVEDGDGVLCVGTFDAGVNRLIQGQFEPYTTVNDVPEIKLMSCTRPQTDRC